MSLSTSQLMIDETEEGELRSNNDETQQVDGPPIEVVPVRIKRDPDAVSSSPCPTTSFLHDATLQSLEKTLEESNQHKAKYTELRTQYGELELRYQLKTNEMQTQSEELENARKKNAELVERYQAKAAEVQAQSEELEEARKKNADLKRRYNAKAAEVHTQRDKLEEARNKITELEESQRSHDELSEKVETQKRRIEKHKQRSAFWADKYETTLNEYHEYKARVSTLISISTKLNESDLASPAAPTLQLRRPHDIDDADETPEEPANKRARLDTNETTGPTHSEHGNNDDDLVLIDEDDAEPIEDDAQPSTSREQQQLQLSDANLPVTVSYKAVHRQLKRLLRENATGEKRERFHLVSPKFFRDLLSIMDVSDSAEVKNKKIDANYEALSSRFSANAEVFDREFIVFPAYDETTSHWFLIIVGDLNRSIGTKRQLEVSRKSDSTVILFNYPPKTHSQTHSRLLFHFLSKHFGNTKPAESGDRLRKLHRCARVNAPVHGGRQSDSLDAMMEFAEEFFKDAPEADLIWSMHGNQTSVKEWK